MSDLLTSAEAAAYLRYPSAHALRQAVVTHNIPSLRRGRILLFDRAELDQWLRRHREAIHTARERAQAKARAR